MARPRREDAMITVKVTRASHDLVVEAAKLRGLSIGDYYSAAGTRSALAEIEAEETRLRAIREAAVRPRPEAGD